jgi:hypothetical protein
MDNGRTMSELMSALDELLDEFDQICRSAFARYRRYDSDVLLEHDQRAAAACIYCHMVAEAERRLLEVPHVKPHDVRGLKVWLIAEHSVIRFKKHDEDGRSRNYPTKQAKDYDRGEPLPNLPPPTARLSVGYFLDPTSTQNKRTQVARPRGREIEWCAAVVPEENRRAGQVRWVDVTRQSAL